MPTIEMVPLSKIENNPWRDLVRNPILPERVEALAESMATTKEFWVGVYGRKLPSGIVQLAFGHQRKTAASGLSIYDGIVEAARAKGEQSIPISLRDFTDGEMLEWMVRENLRGDMPVVLEAVSAAVRALAEGKIEIPAPAPKTPKGLIMYAPSFTPGRSSASEAEHPYTASTLAVFLGGVYCKKNKGEIEPQNSVKAALGVLELEERKVEGFTKQTYSNLPIRDIIPMVSYIKKRTIEVAERRGKTQAELEVLRAERLEAQAQAKAEEKAVEAAHKAKLQKIADAKRDENYAKADALAKKAKEYQEKSRKTEERNKQALKDLDEKIAQKKAWESQQRVVDAYLPIRRDVESLISRWQRRVSERDDEREQVKALAKLEDLKPEDRLRLRMAAKAVGDHYSDYVAAQFAPLPTGKAELKTMAQREAAKRK